MPSARPRLVGRRDEMAALEDEFARAAAGEFRVVLLLGEAGVGKSGWAGSCWHATRRRPACSAVLTRSA